MRFRRNRNHEHETPNVAEPRPLGVSVDPEKAAFFDAYAKHRPFDDMYKDWIDPEVTNPTIRQRLLSVMTAPGGHELPYPHGREGVGRLLHVSEQINGEEVRSLRRRLEHRPDLAEEAAQGVLYWLNADDEWHIEDYKRRGEHDRYQKVIQELLPIVSEDTADDLFRHFSINDLEPASGDGDWESGYDPLRWLLMDQEVPRKYKDAGLTEWADIAEREIAGVSQPRADHERAIETMADFVRLWSHSDEVDSDIFTALVNFLESHTPQGESYVRYGAADVAKHIADDEIRFSFAWRHIAMNPWTDGGDFYIRDEEGLALVEWTQQEASKRGLVQFSATAKSPIEEYEASNQQEQKAAAAEAEIKAQLRAL